jgi:hypothetical protein
MVEYSGAASVYPWPYLFFVVATPENTTWQLGLLHMDRLGIPHALLPISEGQKWMPENQGASTMMIKKIDHYKPSRLRINKINTAKIKGTKDNHKKQLFSVMNHASCLHGTGFSIELSYGK